MNEYRVEAVESAFDSLNPEQLDEIPVDYVKQRYAAERHPDAVTGKRYKEEVKREFIDSFDEFCRFLKEHGSRGKLTKDDFLEYFSHLNLCVEDDDEFAGIVVNSWKPLEKPVTKPRPVREEVKAAAYERPQAKRGAANVSSIDNTLNLGAKLYNQLQISKKEQPKSAHITAIMDTIRENVVKKGLKGVLGMFRELTVIPLND